MIWLILGVISIAYGSFGFITTLIIPRDSTSDFIIGITLAIVFIFLGILSLKKYTKYKVLKRNNTIEQSTITQPVNNLINNTQSLPNKNSKIGCLLVALIVSIFLMFFMIFVIKLTLNIENSTEVPLTPLEIIENTLEISPEQSNSINDILTQCGIEDISSIEYKPDLGRDGRKVYSVKFKNGEIAIHINDGILQEAYFLGHALYKDNAIESTISDYILTSEEKVDLQMMCQHTMEQILISPSTAKYAPYGDWKYSKRKGTIIVQSYVDSQNAFGATIRSEFQFIIEDSIISSLIVNGEEYIKQEE